MKYGQKLKQNNDNDNNDKLNYVKHNNGKHNNEQWQGKKCSHSGESN
jgi:hypothetical protein